MIPDRANLAWAALVFGFSLFGIGFALAVPRELWIKPWLGGTYAVLLELLILLPLAWWLAKALMRGPRSQWGLAPRLRMGAGAMACLLLAELVLSISVLGQSLLATLATFVTPKGVAGLAAQLLACSFPWIQMKVARS
jgi:hypothetical protein